MVRVDVSGLCAAGNSVISMQDITGVGQLCTNLLLADYPLVQPEVTNKYCILFQPLILWQWNLMLSGFLMKHHPMKTKGGEGVQVSRAVFVSIVNSLVAASRDKERQFPLDRKLNEPWSREQTKVFILLGLETQPSSHGSLLHRPIVSMPSRVIRFSCMA